MRIYRQVHDLPSTSVTQLTSAPGVVPANAREEAHMRAAAKFPDTALRPSNLFEFWRSVKKHWELLAILIIPVAWFITYS